MRTSPARRKAMARNPSHFGSYSTPPSGGMSLATLASIGWMGGCGILGGMLFISNDDVAKVLTMDTTIAALEDSYRGLATTETVCRPRLDIRDPTTQPGKTSPGGPMEAGSPSRCCASRMKSALR